VGEAGQEWGEGARAWKARQCGEQVVFVRWASAWSFDLLRGTLALARVVLFAVIACGPAHAQQRLPRNAQGFLENSNTFAVAYAMSFQSYDTCGDPHHGEIARKAIFQKFMGCPFSPQAKAQFQSWLATALPKMRAATGTLRNDPKNCAAIRQNPYYSANIAGLDRFERDQSVLPGAVGFPCDMVPVIPPGVQ